MFELIFVESFEKYGVVVARKTLKINGQKKQFIQINFDNQVVSEYRLSKCDWFDSNLNKVNFVVADDYEFIKSADIAFKDFTTTKNFDSALLYSDISIAQNVARTFKMNLLAIPASVNEIRRA